MLFKNKIKGVVGQYSLTGEKAEGGMGEILFGTGKSKQKIAIKKPKLDGKNSKRDNIITEKLKVETEILRNLSTDTKPDSIVGYVDQSKDENEFFLVTERLSGLSLEKIIAKGIFSETQTVKYTKSILAALDYIHLRGITYRDLKPENIIIDNNRGAVLIDFGAAKLHFTAMMGDASIYSTNPHTGLWACTHQIVGNIATTSCDIYALGKVMFFMLTGRYPNKPLARFPRVNKINPHVSDFLSQLIYDIIDPSHSKIQTAGDVLEYLAQYDSHGTLTRTQLRTSATPNNQPHVILAGKRSGVFQKAQIGRKHKTCSDKCNEKGFHIPPSIPVSDIHRIINQHHLEIWEEEGKFWIRDLQSMNGTALLKKYRWIKLQPLIPYKLEDKTIVALGYDQQKGEYMNFEFFEK